MPEPLTLSATRAHFQNEYKLSETQADLMVQSSVKSLDNIFEQIDALLRVKDESSLVKHIDSSDSLKKIFHSLKGLFLNMGADEWANYVKDLESDNENFSYSELKACSGKIRVGMSQLIEFVK